MGDGVRPKYGFSSALLKTKHLAAELTYKLVCFCSADSGFLLFSHSSPAPQPAISLAMSMAI